MRFAPLLLASSLVLTLCGCQPWHATLSATPATVTTLRGMVHGGQQPVAGSHIYLFAANTTGYGGPGIAASAINASVSLLNATLTGHSDTLGAFVPTAADGSFTVTLDYTCTPGTQVYLYALGGNPGAGTNSAASFLSVLGNCPATRSFLTTVPTLLVNEVTTVAAAYAFAGFASDATHVSSSGSALAQTGIANAFANAANLANPATGVALATTPAGNGTVPQAELNTLANILAACVNASDANPANCPTFFTNTPATDATGALPTDTASAAINIAHNPGVNIATLFATPAPVSPFSPALASQPNDFTIALQFTGGGLDAGALAIDAAGNVWVASLYGERLAAFTAAGAPISPSTGFTGNGLLLGLNLAIDINGNVWLPDSSDSPANAGNGHPLSGFYGTNAAPNQPGDPLPGSPFSGGGIMGPRGIAFDSVGNIWIANSGQTPEGSGVYVYVVSEFDSTGNPVTSNGYALSGVANTAMGDIAIDTRGYLWLLSGYEDEVCQVAGIAGGAYALGSVVGCYTPSVNGDNLDVIKLDSTGNPWISNLGGSNVYAFYGSGSTPAPTGTLLNAGGYTGGGLNATSGLAFDSNNRAWVANVIGKSVSVLSGAGQPISPSTGYTYAGVRSPNSLAVDGAGNVWVTDYYGDSLVNLIGAASPVVTPIVANLMAPYGTSNVNRP